MKIVVDTSVWINYFRGFESSQTDLLDHYLEKELIIVGDLVLLEILQGIKSLSQFQKTKDYLKSTIQVSMLNTTLAIAYTGFYRSLRKNGVTIRKTNDVIIAGYCLVHDLPLLQQGRDFQPFENTFDLKLL